ncbi:MAG TPA: endonuclease VII domain-containing protein [Vicinamibacterales bacterium]|nr:endonuclease VII domain-containing protein [Vicinamibacterales bacterium]
MSQKKSNPCMGCGGPKPTGVGRKLCESCRAQSAERRRVARSDYQRARYAKNRDEVLARIKARRESDPEAFKAQRADQARRRRARDPEKHRIDARRRHIKNKYGITLEEYYAILARGCAICGATETRLCLDHDHVSGKVRDALCNSCNVGLGSFVDDPARLRAAATYLEAHASS